MKYKIILTDIDSRKGFDIYNIFKKKTNYELILCSTKKANLLLKTIFKERIHFLDISSSTNFNDSLKKITLLYEEYSLIYFPISDVCNLLFYKFIANYKGSNILYTLPEEKVYKKCINKNKFEKFCHSNGFLTPKKYTLEEVLDANFTNYPLIVKPQIGTGSKGIFFINSASDLKQLDQIRVNDYIIQERINSIEVHGAFFLIHQNKLVAYYGHKRLRTSPLTGGVSVYSVTEFNPLLQELGLNLLKKLRFNGLAMIEFLYDGKDKTYKIIELNPRTWGSYLLGEFINADFSEKYVQTLINGNIVEDRMKTNPCYIKWLIPYEIINAMKGRIPFSELLIVKNTCFINFTYSSFYKSFLFSLYMALDFKYLLKKLSR